MTKLISTEKLLQKDPFNSIIGLQETKNQIKSALLTERHIILVGQPGVGKTTLAKNITNLLEDDYVINPITGEKSEEKLSGEKRFIRVQGSPDLTAEDLIGDIDPIKAMEFGPLSIEAFTPGKIFRAHNGILFFDEVNRCSEKLQNALLQVLEEGVITIGSYTIDVPTNFIFIGTMNPEDSSTEKLSHVFLDRFDLIYISYPDNTKDEKIIIEKYSNKIENIEFSENLTTAIVQFIRNLRDNNNLQKKPSVRATIGLYERAQANALLNKRSKVVFDDVKNAIISVLSHRIELKASLKFLQKPEDFIKNEIEKFSKNFSSEEEEGEYP
jgi:magnesium chelatase subunit I